jgi:hypothetical protein
MKHHESPTSFLTKHHPVIKATLDYSFGLLARELRTVLLLLFMGGLFSISSCRHDKLAVALQEQAKTLTNVVNYISP